MYEIETSGVYMTGICHIKTYHCRALTPAPLTTVWSPPGRTQVDVCSACMAQMVRDGEWIVPGARVPVQYDIAVFDRRCSLTMAVDVKTPSMPETTVNADWAMNIRRNLRRHAALPHAPYFLIAAFPGSFFLWKDSMLSEPDKQPDYIIQDEAALKCWHPAAGEDSRSAHAAAEQATLCWLASLIDGEEAPASGSEWARESGLLAAIAGGTIVPQSGPEQKIPLLQAA